MGQPFPVTGNLQLTSTHLPHLEDYLIQQPERMMYTINLNDLNRPMLDVFLRVSISGAGVSIISDPGYIGDILTIMPGTPTLLTGVELAPLFNPDNLIFNGISREEYLVDGRLPEGLYSICVEVFDINRPDALPVSNNACALATVEEYDPPVWIAPIGPQQQVSEVQNIIMQWQPMHAGGFPVEYTVYLFETVAGMTDDQLLQFTAPYATITTMATSIVYGPDQPLLDMDLEYMVVIEVRDLTGEHTFKNLGRGKIEHFSLILDCVVDAPCDDGNPLTLNDRYTEDCICVGTESEGNLPGIPVALEVEAEDSFYFVTHWEGASNALSYLLDVSYDVDFVEMVDGLSAKVVEDLQYEVADISREVPYYYRVRAFNDQGVSDFSNVIMIDAYSKCGSQDILPYECGSDVNLTIPENTTLITSLQPGDEIYASDFKVIVDDLIGSNPYSGIGHIELPYLDNRARVNVRFSNILVNDDCRMVGNGFMEVTGTGVQVIDGDIAGDIQDIILGLELTDIFLLEVDETLMDLNDLLDTQEGVSDYFTDGWDILDGAGDILEEYPYLDPDLIGPIDDAIDCYREVALMGGDPALCQQDLAEALDSLINALDELMNGDFQIPFIEDIDDPFGYDISQGNEALNSVYDRLSISGSPYDVPWKSIEEGHQATVLMDESQVGDANVRYETNSQQVLTPSLNAYGQKILTLPAGPVNETFQVYAIQEKEEGDKIVGKLNVVTYPRKVAEIVIVPVNGTAYPYDQESLLNRLAAIYDPAIAAVHLTFHPGIEVPNFDGVMDDASTGFLSNYTDEMDRIINSMEVQEGVNYLFLIPDHELSTQYGYWPRGRPYGFLYDENCQSIGPDHYEITIAHEIAHGAFKLGHIYDDFPELGPGETDNLMDYGGGDVLYAYQWNFIHNPEANWSYNDADEEGQLVLGEFQDFNSNEWENELDNLTTGPQDLIAFYNVAGQIILVPERSTNRRYMRFDRPEYKFKPQGALIGFDLDGERYHSWYTGYQSDVAVDHTHLGFWTEIEGERGDPYLNPTGDHIGEQVDVNVVYNISECEVIYGVFRNEYISESDLTELESRVNGLGLEECEKSFMVNCNGDPISDELCYGDVSVVDPVDVSACIEALIIGMEERSWERDSIRPKGKYHHIHHTPGSSMPMPIAKARILDERLYLLQYHTGIAFHMVYHKVGEVLSQETANDLARQVSDGTGLSSGPSILVVIPYASVVDGISVQQCGSPGVYDPQGLITVPEYQEVTSGIFDFCVSIFKWIDKPMRASSLVYLTDESIYNLSRQSREAIDGHPFINQVNLHRSTHWDTIKIHESRRPIMGRSDAYEAIEQYLEDYRAWEEKGILLHETAAQEEALALSGINTASTFRAEEGNIRLRESYMADPDLQIGYALFHYEENNSMTAVIRELFGAYDFTDSEHLHEDITPSELVYNSLDVMSLVFAPIGGDVVFDALGFIYAAGIDRAPGKSAEYGIALAVPFGITAILSEGAKAYKLVRRIDENGEVLYTALNDTEELLESDVLLKIIKASSRTEADNIGRQAIDAIQGKIKPYFESVVPQIAPHADNNPLLIKHVADELLLFPRFFDNPSLLTDELAELLVLAGEGRTQVLARMSGWSDEVLGQFVGDLGKNPALVGRMAEEVGVVEAWEVLERNNRIRLRTEVDGLNALVQIRKNNKLTQVFPDNNLDEIDDILGKIEGIPNVSYVQMLDELEIAIESLPLEKTVDFWKVVSDGRRGLVNKNNVWDRRHSWLTLKKVKDNEVFFQNADEIRFEVELEVIDGVNHAVPDIVVSVSEGQRIRVLIGEVKAGDNVITSNFNNQTIRYFQDLEDIRDLRFFKRDDVTVLKRDVIDSWRIGGVLEDDKVKTLFEKFDEDVVNSGFDPDIESLEEFLRNYDSWFNTIFNSSF